MSSSITKFSRRLSRRLFGSAGKKKDRRRRHDRRVAFVEQLEDRRVLASLTGISFDDVDGNGVQDAGDAPLSGVTVYLDQNNNSVLDVGEVSTTTNASGEYEFTGLAAGEYIVRQVGPTDTAQTTPLSDDSYYGIAYKVGSGGLTQPALIDPQTGQVRRLGTAGARLHGLVRTNDGEFYGVNGFNPDRFYSLDINTNVRTEIGPIGSNTAFGMAYDPGTDTIYSLVRDPGNNLLKLATIDRTTGLPTLIGPGTNELANTSGLAFDTDRGVVVAFDNNDDQFWEFDLAGNPTLLFDTSGLNGWGFTYNGDEFLLQAANGNNGDPSLLNRLFYRIDPYAQTIDSNFFVASEAVPLEALDYLRVDQAHLVYVDTTEDLTGLDFGSVHVNQPPVATPDTADTTENASILVDVLANDTDVDDSPSNFSLDSIDSVVVDGVTIDPGLVSGSATVVSNQVLFQPGTDFDELATGESATVTIGYTMSDDEGASSSSTLVITVSGVNDSPVIGGLTSDHDDPCDSATDGLVTVAGLFADVDLSDTHVVSVDWGDDSPVESLTVDQLADTLSGSHVYDRGGVFIITVTIEDSNGGTDTETTTAVVQGVGVVDGTLYIIGTEGRDHVKLKFKEQNDELKVDVKLNQGGHGGSDGGSDGGNDHIKETFQLSSIDRVVAYLCGGDDHYDGGSDGGSDGGMDAAISQFVFGGAGDDDIKGGRGSDVLSGGSGKDDLQGRAGSDVLIGGVGADKLKGGQDDDLLIGGSAENEDDFASVDATLADWIDGDLAAVLLDLGTITDDFDKDDLKGEQGADHLIGGDQDKLKD